MVNELIAEFLLRFRLSLQIALAYVPLSAGPLLGLLVDLEVLLHSIDPTLRFRSVSLASNCCPQISVVLLLSNRFEGLVSHSDSASSGSRSLYVNSFPV